MSIKAPRYKPTDAYFLAALNLCSSRIDEYNLSLKTLKSPEKHDKWYQQKLEDEYSKIVQIKEYPQCVNPVLKSKIETVLEKCRETAKLLEEEIAKSLCKRITDYTISLSKSRDEELASSYREITRSFRFFRDQIEDYEDDSSSEAQTRLRDATCLLESTSELIDRRLSVYDFKQKRPSSTSEQSLLGRNIMCADEDPIYHPTKAYYVAKAMYRKARINEFGVCLNQQIDIGRYAKWFEKSLEKESSRIDAVEESAKRYSIDIPDEIYICRTLLIRVYEQFQKKLNEFNSSMCIISSSSASSSSSSTSFLLAPKAVYRTLSIEDFEE
jgi:hypothetical protein